MNTIILRFISRANWQPESVWNGFLENLEECFEDKIYKLDDNDPMRRKSNEGCPDGEYISKFKAKQTYRVVFGVLFKTKVEFDISYHCESIDSYGEPLFNSISFHIKSSKIKNNCFEKIISLFDFTNMQLKCFHSFADYDFKFKHLKTNDRRVNITKELPGIFWLTYFNKQYVDLFSLKEKLDGIVFKENEVGGIVIQMSETPDGLAEKHCIELEQKICSRAFFRNSELNQSGEHVIPLEEII